MKILLCNDSYPPVVERLSSLLPGHEVLTCHPSAVAEHLHDIDVIIPSVARITAEIIERGTFGLIQQLGVGLDNVDIPAATEYGAWVARVPGAGSGNAESVAELAVMFMIALCRKYVQARKNIDEGVFFKPGGKSLLNKTVCIIGFGDIGTELARRLVPFGVNLKAVRRRPEADVPDNLNVKMYGLNDLASALADSDFVVLALPENSQTKELINRETLALMKPGVYLINVARGGLIDHAALLDALKSGHVAGAGLDVFVEEPTDPNDPIFQENVLATPHIGGNTDASYIGVTSAIAENVKRFEAGERPLHVVNELNVPVRAKSTTCKNQ